MRGPSALRREWIEPTIKLDVHGRTRKIPRGSAGNLGKSSLTPVSTPVSVSIRLPSPDRESAHWPLLYFLEDDKLTPQTPVIARTLPILLGLALVLGFLYWARVVLIPVHGQPVDVLLTPAVAAAATRLGRRPVGTGHVVALARREWRLGCDTTDTISRTYPRYERTSMRIASLRRVDGKGWRQGRPSRRDASEPAGQSHTTEAERQRKRAMVRSFRRRSCGLSTSVGSGPHAETCECRLVLVLMIFMLINRRTSR